MSQLTTIIIIGMAALVVIVLLVLKNKKDRKLLNPDAEDSMEESRMDHERRAEHL